MQCSRLDMLITDSVSVNMSVNLLSPECKHDNTRDVFYILHFTVGEMTQLLKALAAKPDLLSSIPRGRRECYTSDLQSIHGVHPNIHIHK